MSDSTDGQETGIKIKTSSDNRDDYPRKGGCQTQAGSAGWHGTEPPTIAGLYTTSGSQDCE